MNFNLSETQRRATVVTFDNGKFSLYVKEQFGFVFLKNYNTKELLRDDLTVNGITNATYDHGATMAMMIGNS